MNNYDRVDIYNENRENTGKTKINSNKEILISKRAEQKRTYPLMWECNGRSNTYR